MYFPYLALKQELSKISMYLRLGQHLTGQANIIGINISDVFILKQSSTLWLSPMVEAKQEKPEPPPLYFLSLPSACLMVPNVAQT